MSRAKSKKRTDKDSRSSKFHIGIIVAFLVIVMTIQLATLYQKSCRYHETEEALQAQLEHQQEKAQELADYEVYTQSDEYIENTAKSKLGLIRSNEIIFREK